MPTLEDILKAKKEAGSANIVPMPRGDALTMEEIQALNSGKPDPLPDINSPNIIKDKNGNPILDKNSPGISDSLYAALNSPKVPTIEQALQGVIKSKHVEDESTDEDISDQLARYDFPLYAETDALNEATAYNRQSNMDAIIKGAKNIVPVAIGVGAQMLGGTMQIVNNLLGDDDYDNPITEWGRDFMKNNMNIIYQSPDGKALSSAKSAIAAGSDILGQFGSAVGSMVAMSPINTGIVRGTTALGTALGGPLGGMIGSIAGTIGAAALNAYSEGVIDASEVYDKKYKELWNNTRNLQETQKVAKLAAQTVANQNMILNTGLNIIPVIWSTKPWGVDKAIKRSLGLPDADTKWFNLQKPYAPNKLVNETFDEYTERLANIKANQFVNNKTYSLTENPFEALKNIKTYGTQKVANIKYNALHPIEYLHRNWDIVGETVSEGLEEYHNYFAREQGLKVFREEDASKIPSMSKLVKGYADMITKGDGAYDLIAGSIIGGMSSPIMSGFHFGRSKVYNPDTGQMDYKFKRNKMFDWIPFELNHDYDQKEYENLIVNSLQRINDVKALGKSYVDAKTPEDKDKVINQLLVAPLTKYVDDNTFDAFMLSLDAMKKNIDTLGSSDDFGILQDYMSATDKINFQNLQTQLDNETDESKQQGIVIQLDSIKDKAKKLMTEHSSTLAKRISFLKDASEDYKKLKDDISANYGDEDYGFANALFKNKMAFEIEQDILKKSHENLEKVKRNFKDKIRSTNPNAPDYVIENIMNELIRNNSNDPNYTDNISDFLSAKKAMLESEFRLERFAHRYVSLSTWGYSNDSDLQRELELVEDISNFVMSDDEIRNLANADKFEEINNYLRFLPMLEAQLNAETDPAKKAELQAQVNSLNNLKSLIDPTTNDAYAKYQLFKSLQEELKQVMQRQVSYKLDFKGNEYNYKGFTPLEKYLKRNKMIADELQKLSSAKRDMDILNDEIISVYKEYADKYSDAFTEEQKQLSVITNELQKLVYDGVIDMSRKPEVDDWLNNHDTIFNEVMGKLLAVTIKYGQLGMENPFIVNYAKKMIQQMNYQKDVIDQLRQLQFYYHAKLIISKDTDIIDLLNNGAITVPEALDYVRNSKVIHDSLKPMLIDTINSYNAGTNYEKEISIPMDLPIVYINTATNDMVVVSNIKIKYSNKDGVLEKNENFDTDVDLKDYVQFKDDTEIDEQRLKDDLRYLALILKAVDYMSNENAEKLLTEIYSDFNTLINRIKEYAISNNLNKDSMDVIKDILGGFKYSTNEIKENNKKLIELLSNITLFLHDNVFNESTILKKGSDHKLLKNIDNNIFEDIINNSSLYDMNTLYKSIENHTHYNISKIINDNNLYKVLSDGTIIFFSLPYYYPYFDGNNKQNLLNFLNSITNIEDVEKNINSINQNYRLIVFNPNDDSYISYTDGVKLIEDVNTNKDVFKFNKSEWDKSKKKTEKIEKTLEVKWKELFNSGKLINLEDVNNVNEILNNTTDFISGKNKEAEYVWVLWKLSDTNTNNPHMFIYLKSIHDSKYKTYKNEYDNIVKRYEKSISDTDTEVFASDDAGIIYKIKSVKGIIESERSDNVSNAEPKGGFQTFNIPIFKKEDLANVVAGPLLKASEIFWDKNIQTTGSWIPSIQDIDGKTTETYIDIAYDSLSDENKKIAEALGKIGEFGGIKHIHIVISNRNLSLEEIQKKSIEIANKFKSQSLLWYKPTTLQDAINSLEERRTKNPTIAEQINKEIQKIKDTWGTNLSPGEYFDNDTKTIWDSEELYKKSKGLSTSTDAKAGLERLSNKKLSSSQGEINTGKLEEAVLPNEVVEKSIAQDIDGNWIEVYINNPKLQGVLLARNGNYLFRAMQGRFFVIAKVGNFYLPFYISSAGTSGKNEGEWYPFFGYNDWLVKGRVGKKGEMEYSEKISQVQKLLNDNFRIPAKFFTQFGQIINGKGTPVNPDKVFYDISEHVKYESWFVDFDRQEDNKYTEEQFVADRTGLNPKNVVNDGKGSADSWIRDVVALTEDANTASKGIISNIQPTVSTDAKADIKRTPAIGDTLTSETDKNYRITGFTDKGNIQWINTIDGSRGVWDKDVFRKYIREGRLKYDLKLESKKETELLQDGKFYTDVKTTDEKVKSDTDIIKDIRAYYYDIVKKSPLKGSEKGRKAVLELIKNLPDIQMLKEFITQLYVNIREADYTPAKDSPFNNDIEEITGKATKNNLSDLVNGRDIIVVNQNGWHYRQVVGIKKDPVKYRFSLNVWGNKDLIKILDDIAIKYKIYYKTPNSSDKWNDRHDPVTIYISNSSLTESQINELKREIVEKTKPYIRSNNGFGIYGDNISKGVEFGLESTQEEVDRILSEAAKLSPLLEEAIKEEFTKRSNGKYKSSVGQNMAAIQAIELFKRMSTKGKNKLNPDKIYFVESGVLKSINQQGTVEIVRNADINSIKGRRVNNPEHIAILNAIKNSKLKLHNLINLPKSDTDASAITNTSTLFKKASNNSITLKVDKINDKLIEYSFIDELKRFIYKDIDERFVKFLNSMYIVEPPKKDGVKKDPNKKVDEDIQNFGEFIVREYADYIFEIENGALSQSMLAKLEKLVDDKLINRNSILYKSIKNLAVTNRGAYSSNATFGTPILTLADLYFTGILSINMRDIEKSKNEIIAKLNLLKKALFEPETASEELSDMSKAFVNNARGSDLIFVNGNYVSFKTNDILKEQSINDDTEIKLGETITLKLMPIDKVRELGKEILIDSNYFININSIFSNEELLYDIYKNNHMLLNYNVDRFLINNDIAKVIVNSITDELRAKFANRLLNEIKEGLKDSSKAEKWGFMFSIKDGKNDNRYNIFMYNKKSNPNAKKSYNHEVQKVNITNDELKITIAKDGDSKQLITYDEKLLLKGLIDGTIKIGIMDEIIGKINPDNNNRVKPLNKDYAWQKNSYVVRINLDGTNTLRKFDLELNEEPESIYLGATEIGYTDYKLYYDKLESDKFYGRNLRKGENSLTEVVFYDKDNNWKSFYTFIPFVIFPFFEGKSGIDINEKFEKVFNELESTFTIYDIISKMFHKIERFNVSRGNINEFKALLESLKSNEIFKDKNLDSTDFILYYIADFMNYAGLLNKNISLTLDPLKFNNIDGIINIANFIKEVKEELGNIDFNDVELVLERLKLSKNELDVDDIINEEDKKIDNGESIDDTEGDIKADDSFDVSDNRGELVLNETAIANSHRKYEFFSTNIIDTFTQIDMPIIDNDGQFSIEPLLSTVLSDSIKDKRSADMKKTLEEGIPLQDKIKIKVQYSNNDIKFIHDGEEYSVSNRGQYIDLLNKVFNKGISINKYEFLKREKLLDLLYMYDIKIDNNGNILSIEFKSSMSAILTNHSNQNERDVAIKQWYNTQSLDENLLRKLFIISRMQMIISTNNDDNTHLGYVHDLPYIINHISSVSQHNRVKFSKTVIEQLSKEILYVIESFNKKIELYNSFENTDEVLATAEFSNYGKVNTLNGDREPLVTAMKKETYYKYIVTKVLENGLYNFKLENMDDSGKYVDQLYKNMPASDYLRFILIPYFSINNDGDNLSFEQASSKIIKIISDINNSQDNELNNILTAVDSKGNAISDMSKLYSIYQLKNEFLDVKSKVENRALALKYSEREPIFNYLIISVKNKFSNETKFFKASNLRLKELNVPSVYSQDNLNDDDFKNVELKRKKSEKLMEILLENIISLINDIRANRKKANILFDNNFKDPLLKLRNIIKTVIIEQELNIKNKKAGNSQNQIYDNNKNILNKLSGYKGDITTLFYLSIKTGNKIHKSKLVFATKKGNIVSLIEIPIYNEGKLVDASVLPTVKVYDISKGVDVKTFTTFSYNEDLLKEAILDSYLIAHYDESKTKKVIKDIIDSDSYSDYLSYIFDTHVNGINGHYFINPVITIGNIEESDKKQPETQVESQVAQSENVADLSNKIDEVVDKIKNNRVLNSLKVHLDTILLIKNYLEFISNNINDINNIINSTNDTKTRTLVNKLVTKFNNYCKP